MIGNQKKFTRARLFTISKFDCANFFSVAIRAGRNEYTKYQLVNNCQQLLQTTCNVDICIKIQGHLWLIKLSWHAFHYQERLVGQTFDSRKKYRWVPLAKWWWWVDFIFQ